MLLPSLPEHARLWTFVAPRPLAAEVQEATLARVRAFLPEWVSHGRPVAAEAACFHDRALVVGALLAEIEGDISGCGIDAMTHAVEAAGSGFAWLDGLQVVYQHGDDFAAVPRATLRRMLREGAVSGDTLVLDPTLPTVGALRAGGGLVRPLGATPLGRALGAATPA